MTAAAKNREAPEFEPNKGFDNDWPILNDEIVYTGTMIGRDYLGEVQALSATEGLQFIGVNKYKKIDNADDGERMPVTHSIFRFDNSATYPIVLSGWDQIAYCEDDQTVASHHVTVKIPVGLVRDVTSLGVFVDTSPLALAIARMNVPILVVAKTAAYTLTAANAFQRNNMIKMTSGAAAIELTLPSAVAGMRFGVMRGSATATHDVTIQAAAGDKIEGSDGLSAAAKQVDNTVDAISQFCFWEAVDNTHWALVNPIPSDVASWVKNDA